MTRVMSNNMNMGDGNEWMIIA